MTQKEKDEDSRVWREKYIDNVSKMLTTFQASKPTNKTQFVVCVNKLSQAFPPVADRQELYL